MRKQCVPGSLREVASVLRQLMATGSDISVSAEPAQNTRHGLYLEVINSFIAEGSRSSLSLVVLGEAGQGKSTLINGLVGSQIAIEGDDFDAGTTGLDRYQFNQNGVLVDIWDTPGFGLGDPKEEEKTLEEMARDIKRVDLVLYCMRIDSKRWPKRNDMDTIMKITKIFSKEIWSHCLFVLTFANYAAQQLRPEDDHDTLDAMFSRRVMKWEDRIREKLQELAHLSNKETENIRAVPVGSHVINKGENPWALPDREDWFISFWLDVTEQMREAALPSLLQLNRHRLAAQVRVAIHPEDRDQNSANPIVVKVEVHARSVPGKMLSEVDSPDAQLESPNNNTASYTSDGWSRSHCHVDENIYDDDDNQCTSSGGSERIEEKRGRPAMQKPNIRVPPLREILRNKLDKVNSGFWKYVVVFAKPRGKQVPAIGYVGGFIEGFLQFLGSKQRKRMLQGPDV